MGFSAFLLLKHHTLLPGCHPFLCNKVLKMCVSSLFWPLSWHECFISYSTITGRCVCSGFIWDYGSLRTYFPFCICVCVWPLSFCVHLHAEPLCGSSLIPWCVGIILLLVACPSDTQMNNGTSVFIKSEFMLLMFWSSILHFGTRLDVVLKFWWKV